MDEVYGEVVFTNGWIGVPVVSREQSAERTYDQCFDSDDDLPAPAVCDDVLPSTVSQPSLVATSGQPSKRTKSSMPKGQKFKPRFLGKISSKSH